MIVYVDNPNAEYELEDILRKKQHTRIDFLPPLSFIAPHLVEFIDWRFVLKDSVREWCELSLGEDAFVLRKVNVQIKRKSDCGSYLTSYSRGAAFISFVREPDYILFKLKWM
jgi:hypothetical protein